MWLNWETEKIICSFSFICKKVIPIHYPFSELKRILYWFRSHIWSSISIFVSGVCLSCDYVSYKEAAVWSCTSLMKVHTVYLIMLILSQKFINDWSVFITQKWSWNALHNNYVYCFHGYNEIRKDYNRNLICLWLI